MGGAVRVMKSDMRSDRPNLAREPRLDALDALRASAMLLVVIAHAALSYHRVYLHRLLWAIHDPSRSFAFDALFWACIGVAMPSFFFLGGFLAVRIEESRGRRGFVRDRFERIVVPFLGSVLLVLPVSLAVWGLGWVVGGRSTVRQILKLKFLDSEIKENYVGPAHLWFLEYLIFMLVAFWVVRGLRRRTDRSGVASFTRFLLRPWAPIALAVPTALILWISRSADGLDAMIDHRNSFIPNPYRWLHHAWFFLVGVWFYAHRSDLERLAPRAGRLAVLALACYAVRLYLIRKCLLGTLTDRDALALAASGAVFAWVGLFASLALALRWFSRPRASVRFLADRSYWIYLTHFPVAGLAQVTMATVAISSGAKFAVVLGVTLLVGLLSFEVAVRNTILARYVGGGARGSKPTVTPMASPGPHFDPAMPPNSVRQPAQ